MISRILAGNVDLIRVGEASPMNCEDRVTQIFEEARDDIYRYLVTLGLRPPSAQDATQEVFLRLYVALRKGERIENPRGWIFRVAHNHGLTIRNRESIALSIEPDFETQIPDRGENPEQALLDRERRLRFHHAVEALSDQQRNCLSLRAEGFRYREIAEILGVSDSSVCVFLQRAIRRLRKTLYV
jgi:RNA polymerase sigma-70 factor (ECF subfamily)